MSNDESLRERVIASRRSFSKSIGFTERRLVFLGDGQGNVQVTGGLRPREVYYRNSLNSNDKGVAVLADGASIPYGGIQSLIDKEVVAEKIPGDDTLYITRLNSADQNSPMEQLISQAAHPTADRVASLRGRPTSPPSRDVYVDGGQVFTYLDGGSLKYFYSGLGAAGAAIDALGANEHQLAVACLDPSTGLITVVLSTAVTAVGTVPSRNEFGAAHVAALTLDGYYPSCVVYLYENQAAIEEADFLRQYDPRLSYVPVSDTGSTSTVTTSNNTATLIAAIPVPELSAVTITGEVAGAKTDYTAALGATFSATFRRASGGNVTLVGGATVTVVEDSSSSPTVTVTANTGTQTIDIKVTGVTAEDWTWRVNYRTTTT
jgi:hypothetical protein